MYTAGQIRKQDVGLRHLKGSSVLPQSGQANSASPFLSHILSDDTLTGVNRKSGIDFTCPSLGIRIEDLATGLPFNFNYSGPFSLEKLGRQILTAAIRELLFSINYVPNTMLKTCSIH